MSTMSIGEFARRAKVNIQTVRYYERRGLLPEPERKPSGYREYSPDCLQRLRFIRRSQELGFTLSEIQELLTLRTQRSTAADDVRSRVAAKVADIEEKVRDLQRVQAALEQLASECRDQVHSAAECPLLTALGPVPVTCTHG